MKVENFIFADYCTRIGFSGQAQANVETLAELMRCQLFNVPFENLDVQAGKTISIDPQDIVNKIVYQPRGGYCYEVNSLFAMALESLGIDYQFVAARPMFYPARRPKTHMVVIAKVDREDYLCDLGFGSYGIRAPMALSATNIEIQQDFDSFKLTCADGKNYIVQALVDGEWINQFGFDLYPHELLDFIPANYFNSNSPDTIFVQKLLVVKHTPLGRKILLDNKLKIIEQGETCCVDCEANEIDAVLNAEFGLVVQG